MGFLASCVALIMKCVTIVHFLVMLNGQPCPKFIPRRDLRQGYPLSPYLFILCGEVLSGMLRRAMEDGALHDVRIARQAPIISHLFFADDSIIFS